MTTRDELIDEFAELAPFVKDLNERLELVKEELRKYFKEHGEVHVSESGTKLRMDLRLVVDDQKLEQQVTPAIWRSITKRVSVATLIKAAVLRGKIKQDVVDSCKHPNKGSFKLL